MKLYLNPHLTGKWTHMSIICLHTHIWVSYTNKSSYVCESYTATYDHMCQTYDLWARVIYENHMSGRHMTIWKVICVFSYMSYHMSTLIYEDQTYDDSYMRIYAHIWSSYMSRQILIYEYLPKLSYVSICLYSYMRIRHMMTHISGFTHAYETHIPLTTYDEPARHEGLSSPLKKLWQACSS